MTPTSVTVRRARDGYVVSYQRPPELWTAEEIARSLLTPAPQAALAQQLAQMSNASTVDRSLVAVVCTTMAEVNALVAELLEGAPLPTREQP